MSITDDLHSTASLCVLASGSAGNCSVLRLEREGVARLVLIDLGLSPRRTFRMLADLGHRPDQIDHCLLTHLDGDHMHAGWRRQMPPHARIWMHERHARAAGTRGWLDDPWRSGVRTFEEGGGEGGFDVEPDVRVRPLVMPHDELGVAAFRLDFTGGFGGASLGFATDLGRVHAGLAGHFCGGGADRPAVDVLAIESNYCPVMQHNSTRPDALKRRVMGGHGHLSNQEAVSAILQIEPREHVVLLHLSRECNDPAIVAALHAGADYALTISSQDAPTRWVRIGRGERAGGTPRATAQSPETVVRPRTLWSMA
ncbi:MAG: MBL fold metallo-hydrolase [Phycisphaerales bacterium]|nr:MBL fold metallo-hydrolase [Phycisphaerales bacterium]